MAAPWTHTASAQRRRRKRRKRDETLGLELKEPPNFPSQAPMICTWLIIRRCNQRTEYSFLNKCISEFEILRSMVFSLLSSWARAYEEGASSSSTLNEHKNLSQGLTSASDKTWNHHFCPISRIRQLRPTATTWLACDILKWVRGPILWTRHFIVVFLRKMTTYLGLDNERCIEICPHLQEKNQTISTGWEGSF